MHKSTQSCTRAAVSAVLFVFVLLTGSRVSAAECVAVTTTFLGVPATNCVIPSIPVQIQSPVSEVADDGFPNSFLQVTLSNVPPGYSVTNGVYRGWCVDYDGILASATVYKPIMYLSTTPLPPHLVHTNWDMVNYILNHKQGSAIDVQGAIWRFIGGPVPSSDPVFYKLSAAGSNMVSEAKAYGEGFVPGPGEVTALIMDLGPVIQLNIIEVSCPGILSICPGANYTLCITNRGTAPFTLQWLKDGTNIAGATGSCLTLTNLQTSDSAIYSIRVANNCGVSSNYVQLIITNSADLSPPVITCATGRLYQCLSQVPAAPDFVSVSATDNSGSATITFKGETRTTNGCDILVTRRYEAMDPCGNLSSCERTDTVRDTQAPVLTGVPSNASYQCVSEIPVPSVSAIDNCDTNMSVFFLSSTSGVCPKIIFNRWWAIDRCGNAVTNTQTVTVQDTISPVVVCPPDIMVGMLPNVPPCYASLAAFIAAGGSAVDNCGPGLSYACVDGPLVGNVCSGYILRTHTITDACTNRTSCIQRITILSNLPPAITCPAALTVQCLSNVPPCFTSLAAFIAGGGTASGSNLVYSCTDSPLAGGSCGGTIIRTHAVVDFCGTRVSCTQVITVRDTVAPTLTCAPSLTVECGAAWNFTAPTALDNCLGTNVTVIVESTTTNRLCGNTYSVTRTWRATDLCTNSTPCSQTITIVDTTPPTLACQPDQVVECGANWSFGIPTASDMCDGTNVAISVQSTVTNRAGFCGNTYSVTRTWKATDSCTNAAQCSQTVRVLDRTAPTILCAADAVVECGSPWSFTAPTANDICDGTNVAIVIVSTVTNRAGFCGNTYSVTRTWRATDSCTNSAQCSQTIQVLDRTSPTVTCAADLLVECGAPWAFTTATANDICDGTNVAITIVSTVTNRAGFCGNTYSVTRTWMATDSCTNSSLCAQTIRVQDTTAPTILCAADVLVECGTPWSFTAPTASDICDGTNVAIAIVSTVTNRAGFCGNTYSVTRTWKATDACTNSSLCSQTIRVQDTTPPTVTCATDLTVECGKPWNFTAPTASDICDGTNVAIAIVSTVTNRAGFCGNTYSVTRTWRATDSCTNNALCSQTVRILDTTPPVIACAADVVVECGLPWIFTPPLFNDICDGTNVTITIVSTVTNRTGFCGNTYNAMRTWRATDGCGNSSQCTETMRIVDTKPPTITCATNRNYECGVAWTFDNPTASDTCSGTNITILIVSTLTNRVGFCGNTYSATRTWRALDPCTNSALCSQTITVVDTTPPVLIGVPGDATVQCLADAPAAPVLTANDICDGTNVTVRVTTNSVPNGCGWLITHVWTATDSCSNSTTRSRVITVRDTTPPILTCAQGKSVECGQSWNFDAPTAADNCDPNPTVRIVNTVTNRAEFCGNTFSVTRIWEALDACTNRSTCSQTITILDTTPPTMNCAAPATVECGTPWAFTAPTANDACDGTNVTITIVSTLTNRVGLCGNAYTATRTWKAIDKCQNAATCSQTITVVDATAPQIVCANAKTVECGAPWNFDKPTATDICDGTNVTIRIVSTVTNAAACPAKLIAIRTWEAVDSCTNVTRCSQTVTVVDMTAPTLTCTFDKVVECGTQWEFDAPQGFDLCDGANITIRTIGTVTNFGQCPDRLLIVRTWEAADSCTNVTRCSQTVRIIDTMPPDLIGIPQDAVYSCLKDVPAIPRVTADDMCDGTNVLVIATSTTNASGCGWVITQTWTAFDACSNSAALSRIVTVRDLVPPVLTCAANKSVECGAPWSFDAPGLSDNCDTNPTLRVVSTITNRTGFCGNTFSATRTWEALDNCTNRSTCSQTVTIVDLTPPVLTCAPAATAECGAPWAFTPPTATDVCSGTNVTIAIVSTVTNRTGMCGNTYRVTRTWQATDPCTNTSTCSQTITIIDTTPPVMTCVPDKTVQCGLAWAFDLPTGTDICDGTNLSLRVVSTVTNTAVCPAKIVVVRTWEMADACTNVARCSQSITIVDTTPPQILCAADATVECGSAWAFTPPTAQDNCDGTNVTIRIVSTTTNAGVCPVRFTVTRTWEALDSCTNRATCSQTIGIRDTTPPVVTCAPNATFPCDAAATFTAPTATDVCDGGNVTITIVSTVTNGLCGQTYSAVRTWRALDSCSNAATCSQTITIVDTVPPVLNCGTNFTVECGAAWSFTIPTATDNCSTNVTIVPLGDVTNSLCGRTFRATRITKATDACGNSTTNSQTVTVVDLTPPVLVCQPDRTVTCGTNWQFNPPTATDVCDGTNVQITVVNTVTNPLCGATFRATRTWKATDSCSNAAFCSQTIVLVDAIPPFLVGVPASTNYSCLPDVPAPALVTASDSCEGNVTVTRVSTTNGSCPTIIVHTWTAKDACSNSVTASQTITVRENPPVITRAPADLAVCLGSNATFCVAASSPCRLTYQWRRNGALIPGATNDCYTVTAPSAAAAGQYCVTVSSPCESVSACANLTTLTNVSIGPVPALPCLTAGTNVTICPPIFGSGPFQCAWYRNGSKLASQPSCCLELPNVFPADAGTYTLYVTGVCNVASADFLVPTPVIQCGPTGCDDQTVCIGASFSMCATNFSMSPGVAYRYQWYRMSGAVSNSLAGETNQCFVRQNVTAADAGFYGVVVTATMGGGSSTQLFCGGTIQVPANPVARPLTDRAACSGATVEFCTDPGTVSDHFTFEWRHNGSPIPGATNPCIQLVNVTALDAGQYCVVVSSLAGITNKAGLASLLRASNTCSTVMNCGSLTLLTNMLAGGPANQTVCPDAPVSLCTTVSGTGPFSYSWRKDGVLVPSQTNACWNIPGVRASDAGTYCVEISSPNACNRLTNCAVVVVLTNTTATPLVDRVVCTGSNALFSTTASGTGPFTFAWFHNGALIPNASGSTLIVPNAQIADAGQYCVRVTGTCGSVTNCATLSLAGAMGNFVWEDLNHNGRQEPGEPGVSNVTVQLMDCSSNVLATTTTDTTGFYLFSCLNPGGYRVRFLPQAGYSFTFEDASPDDLDSDANPTTGISACIVVISGETNRTVDAGIFRTGCLGDFVWEDINGNGIQDIGEPGIPNVTLRLLDCSASNVLATTSTGPNGEYLFCGLTPGGYRVEVILPSGYSIGTRFAGTNDCADSNADPLSRLTDCIVLVSGQTNLCVDIGLQRPAALGDFVWEDLNHNGRQDAGEPGMSNVTVRLMECGSQKLMATTTTDAQGYYRFINLTSGTYQVLFALPAGYAFTLPNAASAADNLDSDADSDSGVTACYTLLSGQTNLTVDAGLFRAACLGDFVWEDLNGNGVQDAGEPGVTNVMLRLIDCANSNVVATTTTGANGEYLFCGLDVGSYRVEIVVPGGYTLTTPNSSTNNCADSDARESTRLTDCVTVISGTVNLCVDIGLKRFAALGDFVWNDLNMNGRQDAGEPGMSNITVRLIDCATLNLMGTTTTDNNGRYLFGGLTGGTYKVVFVPPAGFVFSNPNGGGIGDDVDSDADAATGMTGCYLLAGGQTNLTVDAGLFLPTPCIAVTKLVACMLPGDQCGQFGKTATGYRAGTNSPAFCYSIIVSNCGGATLTNLTVIDNQLGDLTTGFFAGSLTPLAPGETVTRWYKMAWDTDTTNSVVASGRAIGVGAQKVAATDLAVAYVDNASISCRTLVMSADDQDTAASDGHVTLVDDGLPHAVSFVVIVCNNGEADLVNVTINTPGLNALGCAAPPPFNLAAGECRTNFLCNASLYCTNLPLSLTNYVTGAVDTRSNHCGFDIRGSNLVTSSACIMEVECGMPGSCRVTGGGRQEATYPSVRYMTHGGQVGAPVGRAGFDPDSRCIHGNWEVVRHDKGGNRGNFHAKNFDSLQCACLACAEDPTANVVVGGLCNPDNRTCGPEPRKAPGNKICFTGVGDYVLTSGNRTPRSVLFRVDIEDRSEPGNSHAGGATPPADRHRIRIWILTEAEMARLNNPADQLLDFRFAISATPATTALQDGAIGSNGLAVPLGTQVFGVRPPDIDDGGEMDHGNHQIHPMIKNCP